MQKRGQISLFMVVGISVLLLVGLFLLSNRPVSDENQQALRQDYLSVEGYVNSCLERGLLAAEELGLREELKLKYEELIDSELKKCSDFSVFEAEHIDSGTAKSEVSLSDDSFGVEATYPILILRENSRISLDKFRTQFNREIIVSLDAAEKVVVAPDRKAELNVAEAGLTSGVLNNKMGIRIIDGSLENSGSASVVGGVAYVLLPEKADSVKATLTLKYNDANLPVSESSLAIAYYDESRHLWEILISSVNADANKVSAEISRFGTFAVVYGWMGGSVSETKDYYQNPKQMIPVDLPNCFKGMLEQFPVKGDSSFMNDWGFARTQGAHEGTDIMAPFGAEIVAADAGKITNRYCNDLGGNAIEISSGNDISYYYAHMSRFGNFKKGDNVNAGDIIGYVGTTIGCQSSCASSECGIPDQTIPHLHFGIYVNWKAQNPYCTLTVAKSGGLSPDSNVIVKDSPNKGPSMLAHNGVVIHSTHGSLQATISWFSTTSSQVSAHRIVGLNGEHYKMVDDDIQAWHAVENNPYYLGIELEQLTVNDPYSEEQYKVAAKIVKEWSRKYGFEINRQNIVGHEETEQGKRARKTDPGPMFDWDKFMALASMD